MSEQEATETVAPEPQAGEDGEGKTFDADYVKKLRDEAAKYRTEAKANAEAAGRLAEIEEANKSEQQKLAERAEAAEKAAAVARSEALRFKIASKFGVSDEDADLFLTGTEEETLTRQAERLAQRSEDRKKQGNVVPNEGNTHRMPAANDLREFARGLFQAAD